MRPKLPTYLLPDPSAAEKVLARALAGSAKILADWRRFEEGEYFVQVGRVPKKVCVVARTITPADNFLCSLLLVDTLRRNGAKDICVVLPYFAYGRQDRIDEPGDALSAFFVADQFFAAGASRIVSLDVHSRKTAAHCGRRMKDVGFLADMAHELKKHGVIRSGQGFTVVSPDFGARARALSLAALLGEDVPVAWLRKRRRRYAGVTVRGIEGSWRGDTAVIVDDMVVTGDTVVHAVDALRRLGFRKFFLCATHALFTKEALRRLRRIGFVSVIVSDSVTLSGQARRLPGLEVRSSAGVLAAAVRTSGK